MSMKKEIIPAPHAPAAKGPYSPIVTYGDLIFLSGQIPLDAGMGNICRDGIEDQARLVLGNIAATLADAGSSLEKALKVTIYLQDMDDFARVNEVYKTFFANDFPARTCVQVGRLPLDAGIEIDVIAHR